MVFLSVVTGVGFVVGFGVFFGLVCLVFLFMQSYLP